MKSWQFALFLPLLVLSFPIVQAGDVGMGISDYEAHPTFALGNSSSYEVAQLINTGRLNLTITGKWISENNKNLMIELFPAQPILLVQSESLTVYAKVIHVDSPGVYKGRIEFTSTIQSADGQTGNPTTPGGTVHATFTITAGVDADKVVDSLALGIMGGVGSGVAATVLGSVLVWRRKRKRESKV